MLLATINAMAVTVVLTTQMPTDTIFVPGDYATIHEAIQAATDGHEIVVAPGVYAESIDFDNKSIAIRSAEGATVTTIDGSGNTAPVVTSVASGTTVTLLDGFTITGGSGTSIEVEPGVFERQGGGLFLIGGVQELRGCVIRANAVAPDSHQDPHVRGGGLFATGTTLRIDDCTFVENQARGSDWDAGASGGGVFVNGGSLVMTDVHFENNHAYSFVPPSHGGGFAGTGTSVSAMNCVFTANGVHGMEAESFGGGMYLIDSALLFEDGAFADNDAREQAGTMVGGAVYLGTDTDARFDRTIFSSNSARVASPDGFGGARAGAVHTSGATEFRDCAFVGNVAQGSADEGYGYGGAVAGGGLTIIRTVFESNRATGRGGSGGAIYMGGNSVLVSCVFAGNSATGMGLGWVGGGAIWNGGGSPTLTNSVFYRNRISGEGGDGGAIYNQGGSFTIANSTFTLNDASDTYFADGGAMFSTGLNARPLVTNCILWDNEPQSYIDAGDALTTIQWSDIDSGHWGSTRACIETNPMFVDPSSDDYRLATGSPLIDAGHNWGVPRDVFDLDNDGDVDELVPLDIDEAPRFSADEFDFDSGCGVPVVVDMGAFEYVFDPVTTMRFADIDGDGTVAFFDLLTLLAAWGPCDADCCLSDLDLGGEVDFEDLLRLLASWSD